MAVVHFDTIGEGGSLFHFDGVDIDTYISTSTTKFTQLCLMRGSYSSGAEFKMRIKSFKFGGEVDAIPVVKGNAIGFYNRVDGVLFLEEQECLTAGPKV